MYTKAKCLPYPALLRKEAGRWYLARVTADTAKIPGS